MRVKEARITDDYIKREDAVRWEPYPKSERDYQTGNLDDAYETGYEEKIKQLQEMYSLVDDAEYILENKHSDLDDLGRLLDKTWRLKRQTGGAITTNSIDALYEKGISAGALGGKLLGAGGGGFLIFYVQPEKKESVMDAMKDLLYVPFQFEDSGTQVIHYTPEIYEPRK